MDAVTDSTRMTRARGRALPPVRRVVAVVTAGLLLLSGCAMDAGTAATVEGQEISESGLHEATRQFNQIAQQPVTPAQVLEVLVQLPVLDEVGDQAGVDFTDDEYRNAMVEAGLSDPHPLAVDFLRGLNIQNTLPQLGEEVPAEALAELDVQLNPRYGSWDPESATVSADPPEWITPVEEEQASGEDQR